MESKRRSYFRSYTKTSNKNQEPTAGSSKMDDPRLRVARVNTSNKNQEPTAGSSKMDDPRLRVARVNTSNKNQEPTAGSSKMDDPRLRVARVLKFETPQKQKTTRKKKSKQTPEYSEPTSSVRTKENTDRLDDGVIDLTDQSVKLYNNEKEADANKTTETVNEKESEIFKEIERLHEIEEACNQILQRQEYGMVVDEIERLNEIEEACNQIRQEHEYNMDVDEIDSNMKGLSPSLDNDINTEPLIDSHVKEAKIIPHSSPLREKNDNTISTVNQENITDTKSNIKNEEIKGTQIIDDIHETVTLKNSLESSKDEFDVFKIDKRLECTEDFKNIDIELNDEIISDGQTYPDNEQKEKLIDENNKENQPAITCKPTENYISKPNKPNINEKFDLATPETDNMENQENVSLSIMLPDRSEKISNISQDALCKQSELDQKEEIMTTKNKENTSHETYENQVLNETKHDEYLKTKQLRQQKRQKYVDFMSDNEDFVWSSSSWEESKAESESSESGDAKKKKKKKKKSKTKQKTKLLHSANKSLDDGKCANENSEATSSTSAKPEKKKVKNIRKENKEKKASGQEYTTKKGKIIPPKSIKPNPCSTNNCRNNCFEISEERRNALFTHFWSLDNIRRKDWLVSHCKKVAVKRHRSSDNSKRTNSINYFINEGEGQRKVCQNFLIKTLDIRQKTLYNTVMNSFCGSASEDMRGKHVPSNKTPDTIIENLRKYIQDLPALPSHYCRKNSKRVYLPQEFRNLTNLYRLYKKTQEENGMQYVGEKIFKKIFTTEFNIGFHFPRKDKCLKCIQFENNEDADSEEKRKHLKDKEESMERFQAHQEIHNKDDTILCTSFDLQKVLNTPHGDNMMLYYSRKLAVYNLTFYESGTRNGFCYTWSEIDGKRGGNEVSSILQKYIIKVDERKTIKHLLLYCDSCPGQNKNKIVLACINETLRNCENLISVQINYLLPGHTYMPVDSVHSVIENSLSGVIIWAPSQWQTVFALARKSPKPYEVEVLMHTDFKKWDTIAENYFKGNLAGKISKLRTVTFRKTATNMAFVKYSMNVDAETETIEILKKDETIQLKQCYKALLPVSKKKYMDLNKLCANNVIPTVYHEEYKRLNYSNNTKDYLIDRDIEDEEND